MESKYQDFHINNPEPKKRVDDEILDWIAPTAKSKHEESLDSSHLDNGLNIGLLRSEYNLAKNLASEPDETLRKKMEYKYEVQLLALLGKYTQDTDRPLAERQMWADEFTKKSVKIYGEPDEKLVREIDGGGKNLEKTMEKYVPIFDEVREFLEEKYGAVLDKLGLDDHEEKVDAPEIFTKFSTAFSELKNHDPRFDGWEVEVKPDATSLSVNSDDKRIYIGEKRAAAKPANLKGLFAHEVLRHAVSAVNMKNLGIDEALPNYISSEEGFAKIYEMAISGNRNVKISAGNYSDIGWVLGQIDGRRYSRAELISRKIERKAKSGKEITDSMRKTAENSAARIFRGTPGNDEVSGVFTKDIAYFGGLIDDLEWILGEEKSGKNISEILEYSSAAKFNVNDETQNKYVKSRMFAKYVLKDSGILQISAPKNQKK